MASVGGVSRRVIASLGGSRIRVGAVTTTSSVTYGEQVLHIMPGAPTWTNPDATTLGWAMRRWTGGGKSTWRRRGTLSLRPQGQW